VIAALYVMPNGPYANLPDVDVWDEKRDARLYAGPHPVVAHPPCERWGRYWGGGPSAKVKRKLGDDGGCFDAALIAVRRYGGVLEHPEASHAWRVHGLIAPPRDGGWVSAGDFMGWTCCVEQGHYGHPARKATWLYAVVRYMEALPRFKWGPAPKRARLDQGYHSKEERRLKAGSAPTVKRLTKSECLSTPPEFRDLLISIARRSAVGKKGFRP
jgi:hypothetical protein